MIKKENYAKAYTEILKIIEYLPDSEYQKIPQKLIDEFQEKSDKEYIFEIQSEGDFENKKLLCMRCIGIIYQTKKKENT